MGFKVTTPDGKFVAYTSDTTQPGLHLYLRDQYANVYVVDTLPADRLLEDSTFDTPQLSDNGRYLAFTATYVHKMYSTTEVYWKDMLTGAIVRIGASDNPLASQSKPSMSADGRFIVFEQNDGASPVKFVSDMQTGLTQKLGSVDPAMANSGNDTMLGSAGADLLFGGSGNDLLRGMEGNDSIDGGAGIDKAEFSGARGAYTFSYDTRGGITVAGKDGSDLLFGVERAHFDDGWYALDIDGNGGAVYRLYQAAFDRVPDQVGLGFWINAVDRGIPLVDVANAFIASPEFTQRFGSGLSNKDFLAQLYQNILHRQADPLGLQFWENALDNGYSRVSALIDFANSDENVINLVGTMQQGMAFQPYTG